MYQAFSELHSAQAVDLMQDIIDVYSISAELVSDL